MALASCRRAFLAVALFSGMSNNNLMLTGALFMLEIYDRVLPSRSVPTLVALLILAGGLYAAQGVIDAIRSRILVRIGHSLDEAMSFRVFDVIVRLPLKIGSKGDGTQPIRDLDMVRGFLSGLGPVALFDLPWMPVYLAICFLFHTYIGLTALGGAVILVILTVATELQTRHPTRSATQFAAARNALMESSRRNAEAITSMGMVGRTATRWNKLNQDYVASSGLASDVVGGLGAFSKVLRLLLQSAILAVGAWLVIHQEFTPGIIIAGSILGGRALAPVDLAIANWRSFVAARQSWQRLSRLLGHLPARTEPMALQPPTKTLLVQNAAVNPPGEQKIVSQDINFALAAGKALGVIGPTASGKSSLARMRKACGRRRAAASASTAPRSSNGPRKRSASTSAICRKTLSCFRVTWRRTLPGSSTRPMPRPCLPPQKRRGFTSSSSICRMVTRPVSAITARRCLPVRRSALRWRARCTATRSWWCLTSQTILNLRRRRATKH